MGSCNVDNNVTCYKFIIDCRNVEILFCKVFGQFLSPNIQTQNK